MTSQVAYWSYSSISVGLARAIVTGREHKRHAREQAEHASILRTIHVCQCGSLICVPFSIELLSTVLQLREPKFQLNDMLKIFKPSEFKDWISLPHRQELLILEDKKY